LLRQNGSLQQNYWTADGWYIMIETHGNSSRSESTKRLGEVAPGAVFLAVPGSFDFDG